MLRRQSSFAVLIILCVVTSFSVFSPFTGYAALPITGDTESPFAEVYKKVAPAVVMIEVETEVSTQVPDNMRIFERFFNIPIPQDQQQQQRRNRSGMGSGIIIDREGYIITNNHVVENATKLTVRCNKNEEYKADVVGTDPETDLALIKLKLDGKLLPEEYVAELGNSDELKPGDYAIAIGNPIGFERTITVGVISGLNRYGLPVAGASQMRLQDLIQTDAQINPGNSGGALANIRGQVIGVNNMYTAEYAAIGFAIPINLTRKVIDQLKQTGKVKRGFVGIDNSGSETQGDITPDIRDALGLSSTEGVLVNQIVSGSPAEKSGLKAGDVIIQLEGEKIKDFHEFQFKIADRKPGEQVQLGVIRDKKRIDITITLADIDEFRQIVASAPGSGNSWLGINVVDMDTPLARQYNLEGIRQGVVVVQIDSGSPASETSLSPGDVITEIQGRPVVTVDDFLAVKNEFQTSKSPILIYRSRKTSNGRIISGYVAIKGTNE